MSSAVLLFKPLVLLVVVLGAFLDEGKSLDGLELGSWPCLDKPACDLEIETAAFFGEPLSTVDVLLSAWY